MSDTVTSVYNECNVYKDLEGMEWNDKPKQFHMLIF